MWAKAARADPGKEADEWPPQWRRALEVPLWNKKRCKKDNNTWRGITLLSVGTKLLARVVASRTQRWSEAFIAEEQMGFRDGRGIDDFLTA